MKKLLLVTCCFLNIFFSNAIAQDSPYVPAGYIKIYSDEFDGIAVISNDWNYRTDSRFDAVNLANNVRVADGKLHFDFKHEPIGTTNYTSGGVISKRTFGYGYYEVCSKTFGDTPGLHTAFWMMGANGNGSTSPVYNTVLEIDGYEIESEAPTKSIGAVHYYLGTHVTAVGGTYTFPNTSTQYVTNAYEWTPTYIKWYVNGTLFKTFSNPKYYAAQNMWLTALGGTGGTDNTKLPGSSNFEYFRYYAKDMSGYNWVGNSGFEYNKAPSQANLQNPVVWCESGNSEASFVDTLATAYAGIGKLRQFATSAYSVKTTHNLDNIPNGTYTLKAWVRSSGGQNVAQLFASKNSASSYTANIPQLSTWTQVILNNIKVENYSCIIGLNSVASANQWVEMDNVEFIQTAKEEPKTNCITNGGFENYSSTTDWQYLKETGNSSSYSLVTTDPADELISVRISAKASISPYGAYITQKIAVPTEGEYELRFKTRSSNVTPENNKFRFKITNQYNDLSILLNDTTTKWVTPTSLWKSYSYKLNLKQDNFARFTFGFANAGIFDLDSVALTKVGYIPPPINTNVIKDSSFDLSFSNTYNPITTDLGWSSFANFKSGEFVSSKITETNGNNFYRCTTSIALDDYNHALSQHTSKAIDPGKYKLSFRSKADAGGYYLKLSTKTASGVFLPTNLSEASNGITLVANKIYITPTTDWLDYSCVFDLNFSTADYIRVFFQFHNKGTYDIDDVKLIPYTPTAFNKVETKSVIFGRNGSICVSDDIQSGTMEIYSVTGELLKQVNVQNKKEFPFDKGIYIVKLMDGKSIFKVTKLIIQ